MVEPERSLFQERMYQTFSVRTVFQSCFYSDQFYDLPLQRVKGNMMSMMLMRLTAMAVAMAKKVVD